MEGFVRMGALRFSEFVGHERSSDELLEIFFSIEGDG